MTSIRVPSQLLAALRAATPAGGSLRQTIESLLEQAGGPDVVRAEAEARDRRARAKASARRLRVRGARAVHLEPEFQDALAEAAAKWSAARRHDHVETWDPHTRRLTWKRSPFEVDTRDRPRMWTKRGLP